VSEYRQSPNCLPGKRISSSPAAYWAVTADKTPAPVHVKDLHYHFRKSHEFFMSLAEAENHSFLRLAQTNLLKQLTAFWSGFTGA